MTIDLQVLFKKAKEENAIIVCKDCDEMQKKIAENGYTDLRTIDFHTYFSTRSNNEKYLIADMEAFCKLFE